MAEKVTRILHSQGLNAAKYGHCFNLVDIGGGRTNGEGSYNGVVTPTKEDPSPWTSS